jgi:hypothetical protein
VASHRRARIKTRTSRDGRDEKSPGIKNPPLGAGSFAMPALADILWL